MPATVEITGCTIRCGPEHNHYGDPWEFSVQVQIFDGVAYLSAGYGAWMQQRQAVLTALRTLGVQRAELVRVHDGEKRRVTIDV